MVLSPNSEIHPMKPSVKVSLIVVAIATIGIGGIAKMVSASSPNSSLMAVAQQKVEPRTNEVNEGEKLQHLAKISASQAQQTAEAAQGKKASSTKLENEDGNLVYAVNIGQKEVSVDAGTGQILYTEDTAKKGAEVEGSRPHSSIQVAESEKGETNDDGK
jgi:Peptidase propeptide and YPEB domain